MSAPDLRSFLTFAEELADATGELLRTHFRSGLEIAHKSDESPVTRADREAETLLRERIAERFPDHGILGEEHGSAALDAECVWVLDPIDGTRSFITGIPLFGTLIALVIDNEPVVGVIDHPALGERWTGARGLPTLFKGQPARVRSCAGLEHAYLHTTSPEHFERAEYAGFRRVREQAHETHYGGDCYQYGLVASGHLDLVIEAGLHPFDWCALVPVLQGAGGRITDWEGNPLGLQQVPGVVAAGDSGVHGAALALLSDQD